MYNKKVLTPEQLEQFIERTAVAFPKARLLWMLHGGEPLINGIDYFKKFIAVIRKMIKEYPVEFKIAIQTNATLLTEEWISLIEENVDLLSERTISVSIDGPQTINDMVRVNASGKGSYSQIIAVVERLKKVN